MVPATSTRVSATPVASNTIDAANVAMPAAIARGFGRFAKRTTGLQKQPFYDRTQRTPLWDCRFQHGLYTEFGDVRELLAEQGDALIVFGPGEEVALDFASPTLAPANGSTRRYVLETRGWCKDMDLFTRDGETIDPLPGPAAELSAPSRTRPMGGR